MAGGKDPGFILYVLFILVMGGVGMVKNALQQKAKAEEQRPRAGTSPTPEDEWEGWEAVSPGSPRSAPPPAPAKAKPSAKVEAILRELERQEQGKAPPPVPQPSPRERADMSGGGTGPTKRHYLSGEALAEKQAPPPFRSTIGKTQGELMTEALSTAFPAGVKQARQAGRPETRPIVLNALGRRNLRQGILFAEVLGQPRAFDL